MLGETVTLRGGPLDAQQRNVDPARTTVRCEVPVTTAQRDYGCQGITVELVEIATYRRVDPVTFEHVPDAPTPTQIGGFA